MPKADDNIFNSTETEDKEININNDMDGYNTGEYVLKAETKINEESLNKDKVMPLNTKLYATDPAKIEFPYGKVNIQIHIRMLKDGKILQIQNHLYQEIQMDIYI